MKNLTIALLACGSLLTSSLAQTASGTWKTPTTEQLNAVYPDLEAVYLDLHRNPELSLHEEKTSAKLAERLKSMGYEVATGVGGYGIVAVLRNGPGHTILLRTDMDALPVEEKTGLDYASHATFKTDAGTTLPVMHACGHDIHMTSWLGTAKLMADNRQRWHGTLVLMGQPAEEIIKGASAMLKDGLLTRFPKPDVALAIHDEPNPAGQVGYTAGYALAASDTVDITIFGHGGHGARPQDTIDPIVIGARTVLSLQTIVSREIAPGEPAVISVGVFNAGTQFNIIPDEANLHLTVRSFDPAVRTHLLNSIERIVKAEAQAGGVTRDPLIVVKPGAHATYNDPDLVNRVVPALRNALGEANVVPLSPKTVSEDFSELGLAGIPSAMFSVGAVNPEKYVTAKRSGTALPGLHSSEWAPDREPTIKTAIKVEVTALLEEFGR